MVPAIARGQGSRVPGKVCIPAWPWHLASSTRDPPTCEGALELASASNAARGFQTSPNRLGGPTLGPYIPLTCELEVGPTHYTIPDCLPRNGLCWAKRPNDITPICLQLPLRCCHYTLLALCLVANHFNTCSVFTGLFPLIFLTGCASLEHLEYVRATKERPAPIFEGWPRIEQSFFLC